MTSATTSGAITGTAQGAAIGATIGGPVGALVGGGLGLFGGLISGGSADRQFKNQMRWAQYNNTMQWNASMANIQSAMDITALTTGFALSQAAQEAAAARAYAAYNAQMQAMTTNYNSLLLADEMRKVWDSEGLQLHQLEDYRNRERGTIVADQASSGTIIGEGSNEDVIVSQQTQRELDKFIISRNADEAVAGIMNQMAQGVWQGQVAIGQTLWEGEMAAHMAKTRAASSAASAFGTTALQAKAGIQSARYGYSAGINNINIAKYTQSEQNTQNMISGLFSAGSTFAIGYYGKKTPGTGGGTPTGGSGFHPRDRHTNPPKLPTPYTPGTSLLTGP